jgi:hypothetical protein
VRLKSALQLRNKQFPPNVWHSGPRSRFLKTTSVDSRHLGGGAGAGEAGGSANRERLKVSGQSRKSTVGSPPVAARGRLDAFGSSRYKHKRYSG